MPSTAYNYPPQLTSSHLRPSAISPPSPTTPPHCSMTYLPLGAGKLPSRPLKASIKWEPDSPSIHCMDYDLPLHHRPTTIQQWGPSPNCSWDQQSFPDFDMDYPLSSPSSTSHTPSSQGRLYTRPFPSTLPASAPLAGHAPIQDILYQHHGHFTPSQAHFLSSWPTSLSSPCSTLDIASSLDQNHVGQNPSYIEWAAMHSPTFSNTSLADMSSSRMSASPYDGEADRTLSSVPKNMDYTMHGQAFLPTSAPPCPPAHISPLAEQAIVDRGQDYLDYSTSMITNSDILCDEYNVTNPIQSYGSSVDMSTSPPTASPSKTRTSGRIRKATKENKFSRRRSNTVTRGAIHRHTDTMYAASAPRFQKEEFVLDADDDKTWTTSTAEPHRHHCEFTSDTGERCTASFARREHLNRHATKHDTAKPWGCPLLERNKNTGEVVACRMRCSRHDNLMDHASTHVRAWLARALNHTDKSARRHEVSLEDAERLFLQHMTDRPDDKTLLELRARMAQITRRLQKAFPELAEETLTFPCNRGAEEQGLRRRHRVHGEM